MKSYRYQVEFNKYDIEEDILNHIIEINFAKTDCKTSFYSFAKSKLGGDIIIIANHGENDLSFEAFTVGAITTKKMAQKIISLKTLASFMPMLTTVKFRATLKNVSILIFSAPFIKMII